MQKELKLEDYVDKKTGFVPAAGFSNNKAMTLHQWWRDTELIFRAVDFQTKKLIAKGLETYMYKNQSRFTDFEKLDWTDECSYAPPLCNKYFETPFSRWLFHQNDSVASKLYIACESKNKEIADKLTAYLEFREFYKDEEGGIWEGDGPIEYAGQKLKKRLRASTICACTKGIETYEKHFEKTGTTKFLLKKAYDSAEKILPCECLATETEKPQVNNLALAFVLAINPILPIRENKELQEQILKNVLKLDRVFGVIRFPGDRWDGVRHHSINEIEPMQWLIGKYLLALITKDLKYFNQGESVVQKFGYTAEGIVNIGTFEEPNHQSNQTYLLETEAVRRLAKKELKI